MAAQNSTSTVTNSQVFSSSKPPATKRGGESFTSQSKREQSASRPTTNRKLSKMSRDVNVEGSGVSRSNSNSLKPQNVDGILLDSANVSIQQPASVVKQSTSLNKLPKKGKDGADPGDITSQSNTLEVQGSAAKAGESAGGGKTPANRATKRAKNIEKKHGKGAAGDKANAKEIKQGASSNKIFELQPTLQRSNTAQGNDLGTQGGSGAQPLQAQNENVKSLNKSEINSKEDRKEEVGQIAIDGRRESINNGSELLLNHNSTAEREHSINQVRPDSVLLDHNTTTTNNGKDNSVQDNAFAQNSVQQKKEQDKISNDQFNFRGRSSSQSDTSNLAGTAAVEVPVTNSKVFEYSKTEKRATENSKPKENKSASDVQDDGQENFGDDEQGNSDHEADESNLNIMEKFRQVMKDRFKEGILENRPLGPPPEELIRKSAFEQEPVKTGAPIAFVKFQRLIGQERIEKMNPDNEKKGEAPPESGNTEINQATTICEYILNARDANLLVYCRFGDRYLADMERRQKSVITALN